MKSHKLREPSSSRDHKNTQFVLKPWPSTVTPASSVVGYHVTVSKGGHLPLIVLSCKAREFEIERNCEYSSSCKERNLRLKLINKYSNIMEGSHDRLTLLI